MALFDKQLELITEGDVLSLVENQEREGYQIEYKQAVAFQNELDKREFLAGTEEPGFGVVLGRREAQGACPPCPLSW